MPDISSQKWPKDLSLSQGITQNYKSLPEMYVSAWESFGNGSTLSPPTSPQVQPVSLAGSANIANYAEWVSRLEEAFKKLSSLDTAVAGSASRSEKLCDEGCEGLANSIEALHVMATVNPKDLTTIEKLIHEKVLDPSIAEGGGAISEDRYVMAIIDTAVNTVSGIMIKKSKEFDALGGDIRDQDPEERIPKPEDLSVETPSAIPTGNEQPGNGQLETEPTGNPAGAPPVWNWDTPNTGLSSSPLAGSADVDSPQTVPPASTSEDQLTRSADAGPTPTSTPSTPVPAAASGMANYGLPMAMMAQLANNRSAANSPIARSTRLQSSPVGTASPMPPGRVSKPDNATARPSAAATSSTPASASPASTPAPSTSASGSPAQSTPPARTAAPVSAAVSGDGTTSKLFTFPDSRTQWVSIPVYNALTVAMGNAAATDGRSAYDNTPAKIPEGHVLGAPTDPNQLKTGDIAQWEHRTALAVAFGADSGGTLEVIVQGQLHPFDPDLNDKHGGFGRFGGFFHPAGVDIPTTESTLDQSIIPVSQSAGVPVTAPA